MTAQILAQAALAQEQSTSTEIVGCLLLSGCTKLQTLEELDPFVLDNSCHKPGAAEHSEPLL